MNDDPIANLDQALRGVEDFAKLIHAHYTACVAAGFARDEALQLTIAFQSGIQALGAMQPNEDPT